MAKTEAGQRKAALGRNVQFQGLVDDLVVRFFDFL
jgi:hypothetical protein